MTPRALAFALLLGWGVAHVAAPRPEPVVCGQVQEQDQEPGVIAEIAQAQAVTL